MSEIGPDAEAVMTSGDAGSRVPFTREEYKGRLDRIRAEMSRDGVDVLFLQSPEALHYLTGYESAWMQGQSPAELVPVTAVAVHVDHDDYILFDNEPHVMIVRSHTDSRDVRLLNSREGKDEYEFAPSELQSSGWLPGTVGFEFASYRPSRFHSEKFQASFERHGAKVVDATQIVRRVRAVKSVAELASIDTAARIADIGLQAAKDALTPGMTELELWGETFAAMTKAGGENQAIPMLVSSGVRQVSGHAMASRKQIMPGEPVFLDVCGVYNRYHIDQSRMFSIGEPDPAVSKRINSAVTVFEELGKVLRPNITAREINDTAQACYEALGIWDEHSFIGGYELGVAFPPDWVGNFIYGTYMPGDERQLVPGTVVNHESQFFLPNMAGFSIVIDSIVVRENEAKFISTFPHQLVVV